MSVYLGDVALYVPAPGRLEAIRRGSAIVGQPDEVLGDEGYLHVYYEGNLYGAGEMRTLADRAMYAYWRMRDRYPTVAQQVVRESAVQRVGSLDTERGVIEPYDSADAVMLARWLDVGLERLDRELQVEGVRL